MSEVKIKGITSIKDAVEQNRVYTKGIRDGTIPVLKTPWNQLNDLYIKGYEPGSVVAFAGHSGTGKTALMCQMAVEMCLLNKNVRVLCLSLETLSRSIAVRMHSYIQRVTKAEILTGEKELDEGKVKMLAGLPIDIYDVGLNYNGLRDIFYEYPKAHPGQTIVYMLDHSLLVDGSHQEEDGKIMKRIFTVVREAKMIFPQHLYVIFSQLNDSVKMNERTDPKYPARHFPRYTDLYHGRRLFQVCDSVVVMNNPFSNYMEVYGIESYPTEGYIFFHVCKSRDGKVETFPLINELEYNSLRELTDNEYKEFITKTAKTKKKYGF